MPIKIKHIYISIFLIAFIITLASCKTAINNISNNYVTAKVKTKSKNELSLFCKIGRGKLNFSGHWKKLSTASFSVKQNERINISLFNKKYSKKKTIQIIFNNNGQNIILCPVVRVSLNKRVSCQSLYTLESDLNEGLKRTVNIVKFIKDGELTCAYDKRNLKSLIPPK